MEDIPNYVLLTDAVPMPDKGHGCSVLSWNWLTYAGESVRLVATHTDSPKLISTQIRDNFNCPCFFFRDVSLMPFKNRLAFLHSLLDLFLFLFALPKFSRVVHRNGATRIFGFGSGDFWFLLKSVAASWATKLPLDFYLVDDLEESLKLRNKPVQRLVARYLEPILLRYVNRVFVISPGYSEHLKQKYRIDSKWLPIPIPHQVADFSPMESLSNRTRTITFLGGINPLYSQALIDLLDSIRLWNSQTLDFNLQLVLLTYADKNSISQIFGDDPNLNVVVNANKLERMKFLKESWFVFMPYSFGEEVKTMVSTSFPSKLSEAMNAGRPILVYGPPYCSTVRYFRDEKLDLVATTKPELQAKLQLLKTVDEANLVKKYARALETHHSVAALRAILSITKSEPIFTTN